MLLIISSTTVFAQFDTKPADVIPPSPTAVGLGKYGSYPVNQSTGLPSIEIPLYEIKVNGYTLPIKLSYHGSGIRVSEDASWVGLGWSLFTGGSVSRTVKGLPDDKGGYLDSPYLDIDAIQTFLQQNPTSFSYVDDQLANSYSGIQSIPDLYHYSINGNNGKFMIDKNHDVQLFPPNGTQVKERRIQDDIFAKYQITDVSGIKYNFGIDLDLHSKETTFIKNPAGGVINYESAWHISNILLPNNQELLFNYQADGTIDQSNIFSQSYSITERLCSTSGNGDTAYSCLDGDQLSESGYANNSSRDYNKVTKIKEIVFPNGRVLFQLGTEPRLDILSKNGDDLHYLSRIDIQKETSEGIYTTIESILFEYSYFHSSDTPIPSNGKRLRLDAVRRTSTDLLDDVVIAQLDYSDINLPNKNSYSVDLFGYYNGVSNTNLIPRHKIRVLNGVLRDIGSADRTIHPSKVEAGSLKSITYPTKGKTEFIFESNEYFGKPVFLDYERNGKQLSIPGKGNGEQIPNPLLILDETNDSIISICQDNNGQNCDDCCEQIKSFSFTLEEQVMADFTFSRTNSNQSDLMDRESYGNVTLTRDGVDVLANAQILGGGKSNYNVTEELPLIPGVYLLKLKVWGDNIYASASLGYNTPPKDKNRYAGGLRIKTIVNKDTDNSELNRVNYEYNLFDDVTKSSGKLTSNEKPIFKSQSVNYHKDQYGAWESREGQWIELDGICLYVKSRISTFYANSLIGVSNNSVAYKNVRMYNGINTNISGYSDSVFSHSFVQEQSVQLASLDNSWRRGELLNLKEYKATAIQPILLKEISSEYQELTSLKSEISAAKMFKYGNISNGPCLDELLTVSHLYQPIQVTFDAHPRVKKSDSIKKYFYDANNVLQNTVTSSSNYFYDNTEHLQLTKTETTTNDGEVIINKTFYPDDVDALNSLGNDNLTQPEFDAIDKLKSANGHRIATPIQAESYKRKVDGSEKLLFKKRSLYKEENGLVLPNIVQTAKTTDALEDRLVYHKYDAKGNPLEVSQVNGTKTVYIWGHHKTLPIAKIDNTSFTNLMAVLNKTEAEVLALTESDMILINNLRTSLPNAMVSTYTYKKLVGITSTTDPRGYTSTYHYDRFNRLQYVKDAEGNILSENQYNYKTN